MTTTTIETSINRKIIVNTFGKGSSVDLDVNDTARYPTDGKRVYSLLRAGEAAQLAAALLGENATVIADLPEAKLYERGDVEADGFRRSIGTDPADVLSHAKALLAIHAVLVKCNAEKEAAKKAEEEATKAKEAANAKRRDAVVKELRGQGWGSYDGSSDVLRAAVDRIIDLEEAAKVS